LSDLQDIRRESTLLAYEILQTGDKRKLPRLRQINDEIEARLNAETPPGLEVPAK